MNEQSNEIKRLHKVCQSKDRTMKEVIENLKRIISELEMNNRSTAEGLCNEAIEKLEIELG